MTSGEAPVLPFESPQAWEQWLAQHYTDSAGIWLKIAKKETAIATVTHDEALNAALCYGWIDGQRKGLDEQYFLQKFTPRRPRSIWSLRNVDKVTKLIAEGKMQPSGQAEVDAAKADGRWDAAYGGQKDMEIPADFMAALQAKPAALEFFNSLNRANIFAIVFRLRTAKKTETRQRRFEALLGMMERGEKIH
jgi:uncharacterized protein YdeI (YjbR/CyaY-like superfamily)